MFGSRRQELKAKEQELEKRAQEAVEEQRVVEAREPFIARLTNRLGQYHEENHVTAHVLSLFSGKG